MMNVMIKMIIDCNIDHNQFAATHVNFNYDDDVNSIVDALIPTSCAAYQAACGSTSVVPYNYKTNVLKRITDTLNNPYLDE